MTASATVIDCVVIIVLPFLCHFSTAQTKCVSLRGPRAADLDTAYRFGAFLVVAGDHREVATAQVRGHTATRATQAVTDWATYVALERARMAPPRLGDVANSHSGKHYDVSGLHIEAKRFVTEGRPVAFADKGCRCLVNEARPFVWVSSD